MRIYRTFKITRRMTVISTRHAPRHVIRCTRATHSHNLGIVVTNTKKTTRLPNVITTLAPLPIIKIPMIDHAVRNLSSLCDVIRVPTNVPITAITVNGTGGTKLLTMRVLTYSHPTLLSRITRCHHRLRTRIVTGRAHLRGINMSACLTGVA